ncbi:cytochrome P450 2D1-like protein [Leptotrombidium deliense]|uniref:Cytochrome P450 2D1-like protein n=1 Tax=Leptotrombidium deliense TaxID=299467 RepID=A0A443S755_9ACAR|nr:cytochrome P450 2D1-like protein [Leptotrombidium deliense]
MAELLIDGSTAHRNVIYRCIYLMATYPDVQQKVHNEIVENIGSDDRQRLPYTQAVLAEAERFLVLETIAPVRMNIGKKLICDSI